MASLFQGEQRRAMIIAAVGFGLVIVLFLGSRLLSGGGDDGVAEPPVTPPTGQPPAPGTPPAPGAGGAGGAGGVGDGEASPVIPIPDLPDAFEIRELRDPFTPPITQILNQIDAPDGGAPGDPGDPGDPAPGDPGAALTLRSVQSGEGGAPFATGEVEGTPFEAGVGDMFGPDDQYSVVSLDIESQCGLFQFVDEPFTACVDEEIPQK